MTLPNPAVEPEYVGRHLRASDTHPHPVVRGDLASLAAQVRICARWALDGDAEWSAEVVRIATSLDELAEGGGS
jgi:hypothetical protein